MSLSRAVVSLAPFFLGLSSAFAQQPLAGQSKAKAAAQPPLYQGVVVDAQGKTIGRLLAFSTIVRVVSGVPVAIPLDSSGFEVGPADGIQILFQSTDCTGTQYLDAMPIPVLGNIIPYPPSLPAPTLFFPGGKPMSLTISSIMDGGGACVPTTPTTRVVGTAQMVDVGSWGLVPPFSAK